MSDAANDNGTKPAKWWLEEVSSRDMARVFAFLAAFDVLLDGKAGALFAALISLVYLADYICETIKDSR